MFFVPSKKQQKMSVTHDLSEETHLALNPKYIEFAENVIFYIVTAIGNSGGGRKPYSLRNWKSNNLKGLVEEIAILVRSSLEDEGFEILYQRYIELTDLLELTVEDEDELILINGDIYNNVIGNFPSLQNLGFDDIKSAQGHFIPMIIKLYSETALNSNIKSANKKQ